jgi:hypothetical protein
MAAIKVKSIDMFLTRVVRRRHATKMTLFRCPPIIHILRFFLSS